MTPRLVVFSFCRSNSCSVDTHELGRFGASRILAVSSLSMRTLLTICNQQTHLQCVRDTNSSSTFFPVLSCAPTQRGCLPRPDQVSKGRSGLRFCSVIARLPRFEDLTTIQQIRTSQSGKSHSPFTGTAVGVRGLWSRAGQPSGTPYPRTASATSPCWSRFFVACGDGPSPR
jgi:hypothetical protein